MYVAMTRARDRLYVCGWEYGRSESEKSWYSCITAAAPTSRMGDGVPKGYLSAVVAEPSRIDAEVPEFFRKKVAYDCQNSGVKHRDIPSEATERGLTIHKLLEKLTPNGDWESLARMTLEREGCKNPDEIIESLRKIFTSPDLKFLFENPSKREVEFATKDGIIRADKVVFAGDDVWIIDYKSDAEKSRKHDSQLAKYARVAEVVYAGKHVRKAILWTAFAELEEI